MLFSNARLTIRGISNMTQSHQHTEPKLQGESSEDYDIRTWRAKLNVEKREDGETIVIPAHGFQQALAAAAKYSKRQIPGQGKATWTAKFTSGIMLMESPALNIDPATVSNIIISANVDGVRGSGKRVPRRFPLIFKGWTSTFDIMVLDPIITQTVFKEMVELTGIFIGVGQFRPQNGGINGRFVLDELEWEDNREFVAANISYMNNQTPVKA